ncbi:Glycosyltransferase like family 2 [Amycolatopsis xylanica]|uniref:Glycosyltransferase like family 2 n=1 Tax=Amycolatopsis xylanica TaxID=589385 RepID=A0A1H2VEK6_9PSEU|nr:glycosyltransferase [Amycolatopsis xylanica]SDW66773.1 Glycosyltransferase like family 2 [Amycolatopsis xylanica]
MITAVGVVVPARDEAGHSAACLRSIRRALLALPPHVERAVCFVADRCTDGTTAIANASGAHLVVNEHELTIGEVRDLGCRTVLSLLARHPPANILLLGTDADTTVAPGWARAHLAAADAGCHAVAGTAELSAPFTTARVAHRYQAILDSARRHDGHGNVYGANLGVRADAYLAVGGFRALSTGEDHDLWRRLGEAGHRLRYDSAAQVVTSSRLTGRAPHGLAALLRRLETG